MKIKSCYPILAILCLAILLFVAGETTAQTLTSEPNTEPALFGGDVKSVSARIASMYGADAGRVEGFVQAAINLENRIGIAAPVMIAIAIQESNFNSEVFINAVNPFGLKANKHWAGTTYTKRHDGKEAKFRSYGSAEEAIWDFSKFIKSRIWYADALACPMDDSRCVIDGLKITEFEPGYSTNPNWDEAVMGIIQRLRLQELATR